MLHFDVIFLMFSQLPSSGMDFDWASGAGWTGFRITRKDEHSSYHLLALTYVTPYDSARPAVFSLLPWRRKLGERFGGVCTRWTACSPSP